MVDKSILLDNKKFTVGTFTDSDKLLHAVETLRKKEVKIFDCYTPFPVHLYFLQSYWRRENLRLNRLLCGD